MSFPFAASRKLQFNNPFERLIGRDQVAHRRRRHLPNEDAITRLVGAIMLDQNDEWTVQRARYITLESMAGRRLSRHRVARGSRLIDPVTLQFTIHARTAPQGSDELLRRKHLAAMRRGA